MPQPEPGISDGLRYLAAAFALTLGAMLAIALMATTWHEPANTRADGQASVRADARASTGSTSSAAHEP